MTHIQLALSLLLLVLLIACGREPSAGETTTTGAASTPTRPAATQTPVPAAAAPKVMTGDFRTHDPGMIRQDQTYYVFSTGDERGLNEGNIQIRKSDDLSYWQLVGTVFQTIPAWITEERGARPLNLWAPDIALFDGKYYLYYAGSSFGSNNSVIGLATNVTLDPQSPDYKWVDEGMVIRSNRSDNWNAIDPSFVVDADGTPWMSFGSFWDGIKMRRLDPGTGKLATDDTTLYSLASRGGGAIEAPAIVFHEGFYYLFVSFDKCCRGANST
jgi:arabinan endo-1,5-alpha-L-arabinosidase